MQADDKWVMKGKLWQPSNEPFYSVSEIQMMARRADAATFDLELALGYYDFKHSWEYERPHVPEKDALLYNVMMEATHLMVIRAEMDEASRTTGVVL